MSRSLAAKLLARNHLEISGECNKSIGLIIASLSGATQSQSPTGHLMASALGQPD